MATNLAVAKAFIAGKSSRSSNGNLHTDGRTLWSYSTPIAHKVQDATGRTVCLHWAHEYSITTTGKHRTALLKALGYGAVMAEWQVPTMGVSGGRKLLREVNHEINTKALLDAYTAELERLKRARSHKSLDRLAMLHTDLLNYLVAFALPADCLPYMAKDVAGL